MAVPSLLTNKIKIISPYLTGESEVRHGAECGSESPDADQSIDASLAVDLQYKRAHFSNSFHSVLTLATP
jgi:hypothetical protein